MTGQTILLQVTEESTVLDVKKAYQQKEGHPVNEAEFVFSGNNLYDAMTMRDAGISDGDTLHLILSLVGGK